MGPEAVLLVREPLAVGADAPVQRTEAAGWLEDHGVLAALIRPDRIVYGSAATLDETVRLCVTYAAGTRGRKQ